MKMEKVSSSMANAVGLAVLICQLESSLTQLQATRRTLDYQIDNLEGAIERAKAAYDRHELPMREQSEEAEAV